MTAIIKREIKNYLKRPLFWIGVAVVILGVFQNVRPYLETRYVSSARNWKTIFRRQFIREMFTKDISRQKRRREERSGRNRWRTL